ncbi:hypothetical protein E2C01_053684 [Portunus trituberculatus]|uniref:Uncharacterized protein n=1 Tax=Portunus trituberculatus TaxID=210409 RepID=A0A5B7GHF7_PORTR|nr:hypothetical protein [Portunus trituberculatus]
MNFNFTSAATKLPDVRFHMTGALLPPHGRLLVDTTLCGHQSSDGTVVISRCRLRMD